MMPMFTCSFYLPSPKHLTHIPKAQPQRTFGSRYIAYAPQSSSREYTLKTQLLNLEMKSDETASVYLLRAQEYSDALENIGEPVKEKDLVMLVIFGLREE